MTAVDRFLDAWSATVAATAHTAPRQQESTAAAPEQVNLAVAMRKALAEMMSDPEDRAELAARILGVAGQIAQSLLAQAHPVVVVDAA